MVIQSGPRPVAFISRASSGQKSIFPTADLMPIRRGEPCIRIYGSPDIDSDVRVDWKPAQRKKLSWVLKSTKAVQAAAQEDAPFFDDDPGEPGE